MTQDNYSYRTSPLFLRNQFDKTGIYGIPIIPKAEFAPNDFDDLRLIGFDKIKSDDGKHASRMVHFFLYDYKFERAWREPDVDIKYLQKYKAVLTPDFSMYTEMPEAMLLNNVFRNRWCGAYWASKGIRVIPSVNFALESSFDYSFEGIEKGSVVALSTYMVQEKEGREAQKEFFMAGYNEMLRRIEPEAVICYHEPFPEMRGNIIYVNYELSSWMHMGDDEIEPSVKSAHLHSSTDSYRVTKYGYVEGRSPANHISHTVGYRVVKHTGYVVQMGAGSAYGGPWKPSKPDDERFLGNPGEIKVTYDRAGYKKETLIGSNGRAVAERHHTSTPNAKYHSNPHDHIVNWGPRGNPIMGGAETQINYMDGNIPNINIHYKGWSIMKNGPDESKYVYLTECNTPEQDAFKTIAEFQDCIVRGGEVVFEHNGKEYGISPCEKQTPESDVQINIARLGEDYSEAWYDTSDDLLNHIIDDKKLREIIKEVNVTYRTI